ncbi:MAG TPA: hypothetical protein VF721_03380 [Pyrinomonadaceae bacterium]
MKKGFWAVLAAFALVFVLTADGFAQGRGRGNGGGGGRGNMGGSPVNRGNSGNRDRSIDDRSDKRRNDSRIDKNSGRQNNRYNGLARQTGMSSASLQKWFEAERLANPNLTFGQFVAANMIARHHDGVSAQRILDGLQSGDSIGQTLHNAGLNERQVREERKRLKKQIGNGDFDYDDRDRDWRFR